MITIYSLILALFLDSLLGDPSYLPHPIVLFGNSISFFEKRLNNGSQRLIKGVIVSSFLILSTFLILSGIEYFIEKIAIGVVTILYTSIMLFYSIANRTLIIEGKQVFSVLENEGIEAGRKQLSRIVGRDTSELSAQQIRIAVLETVSENLSDGVIAPLFYFAILGIPGALTYKMVNTQDSMIGYKSERYEQFGKFAAKVDDFFNFVPARLTAVLILLVSGKPSLLKQVWKEGKKHASPNAGYPEAALAIVLGCQFGGPNIYFGTVVKKPFIGNINREITSEDFTATARINILSTLIFSMGIIIFSLV